eukprot:jgi/Botrbrau1/20593/Bobra.113_1s0019.1
MITGLKQRQTHLDHGVAPILVVQTSILMPVRLGRAANPDSLCDFASHN